MKILQVVLLFITIISGTAMFAAQAAPPVAYVVDPAGVRVGARLPNADNFILGELFVDSQGNVGFISCDGGLVGYDLAKVGKTSANCSSKPSSWRGSLYRQLASVKRPLLLPNGSLPTLASPVHIFGQPHVCAGIACGPQGDAGCVLCDPVDPTDPTWCLLNPHCEPAGNLTTTSTPVPSDYFTVRAVPTSLDFVPPELRVDGLKLIDQFGGLVDATALQAFLSPPAASFYEQLSTGDPMAPIGTDVPADGVTFGGTEVGGTTDPGVGGDPGGGGDFGGGGGDFGGGGDAGGGGFGGGGDGGGGGFGG